MVLDSKGYPHFICTQNHFLSAQDTTRVSNILYASWNGSAWNTEMAISNVSLANMGFLALDSNDYPHIAYVTSDPELMYASWTGRTWNIQTVDTNISALGPCYLALDSKSNPHISYLGYEPGNAFGPHARAYIMYATTNETTPIFTPSPTQTSSPTFPASSALLVLTAIIIMAVATAVYVWKKKTQKKALS
jgi:hypothetical protein